MKSCRRMERFLSSYAHNECGTSEAERLESHLETCPGCRNALAEYRRLAELTSGIASPRLTGDGMERLSSGIRRRIAESGETVHRPQPRFWKRPALAAAIGLLILGIGTGRLLRRPAPPLHIHGNMTLPEIRLLNSRLRDPRIRAKWIDRPVPVSGLIGLLEQIRRLDRRHGVIAPAMEETLEQILSGTSLRPRPGTKAADSRHSRETIPLHRSIESLKQLRSRQPEITLRELALYYAQIHRT